MDRSVSEENKEIIIGILDLIFIPSSVLRLTYRLRKEGSCRPLQKYSESTFARAYSKIVPYAIASALEGIRLYDCYKIGESIFR